MAEIINLNKARKARAKADKEKIAETNRIQHGTPKSLRISSSSSLVSGRHSPGRRFSDVIPANDVRARRITRKPVASPMRRICWLRPSRSVTSSQVLSSSCRRMRARAGSVRPSDSSTPFRQRSASASLMRPCTFTSI